MLKNILNSRQLKTTTKMRFFNSNVKVVLLYGSETWKTTKTTLKKIQTLINGCLRKILEIYYWPEKITNKDLWQRTEQLPVDEEIKRRKWKWIGHTLRKAPTSITRQALTWNPQGRRRKGRPKNTWKRDLEADCREMGYNWSQAERLAHDRTRWRAAVDGLCPQQANRFK